MATDITANRVIVEPADGEFWIMDEDGDTRCFGDTLSVVEFVRSRDERSAKRGTSTVTVIEWRGMPAGFEPPR